jgi:hypothetical protein
MMKRRICATSWGLWLLSGIFVLAVVGCGRRGPEIVPVEGRITFNGGAWPKPGAIYFTLDPSEKTEFDRPASGVFDTDGNVTNITSFKEGDGLIPGKYRVAIECWATPPRMGGPQPKSHVPQRYHSPATSGLVVSVKPGQRVVRLALDVAKQ